MERYCSYPYSCTTVLRSSVRSGLGILSELFWGCCTAKRVWVTTFEGSRPIFYAEVIYIFR